MFSAEINIDLKHYYRASHYFLKYALWASRFEEAAFVFREHKSLGR